MQQRILHGVMTENAFISLLNHNSSSHCVFFLCFMECQRNVFCLFGFPLAARDMFFVCFYFIDFIRGKDCFFFRSKRIWTFIYFLSTCLKQARELMNKRCCIYRYFNIILQSTRNSSYNVKTLMKHCQCTSLVMNNSYCLVYTFLCCYSAN